MDDDFQMRAILERATLDDLPLSSTRIVYLMSRPVDGPGLRAWGILEHELPSAAHVLRGSLKSDREEPDLLNRTRAAAEREAKMRGNGQLNTHHYLAAYLHLGESPGVHRLKAAGLVVPYLVFVLRASTGRGLRREERFTGPELPQLSLSDFPATLHNEWLRFLFEISEIVPMDPLQDGFAQEALARHHFKGQDLRDALIAVYREAAELED